MGRHDDEGDDLDMKDIQNRAHALSGGIMSVKHAWTDFHVTPAEFWAAFPISTVMREHLIREVRIAAEALRELEAEFVRQESGETQPHARARARML